MPTPMENRTVWIGKNISEVYDRHKEVLKGARFKPDLRPFGDKYDKNLGADVGLGVRKEALVKSLQQLLTAAQKYDSAVGAVETDRKKINEQNLGSSAEAFKVIRGFTLIGKGQNADPSEVSKALKQWNDAQKQFLQLNDAHWDKISKLDSQWLETVQKAYDSFEKERKDIETESAKLAADCERLETQIKSLVLKYQKIAVEIGDDGLEEDLQRLVLKAFP